MPTRLKVSSCTTFATQSTDGSRLRRDPVRRPRDLGRKRIVRARDSHGGGQHLRATKQRLHHEIEARPLRERDQQRLARYADRLHRDEHVRRRARLQADEPTRHEQRLRWSPGLRGALINSPRSPKESQSLRASGAGRRHTPAVRLEALALAVVLHGGLLAALPSVRARILPLREQPASFDIEVVAPPAPPLAKLLLARAKGPSRGPRTVGPARAPTVPAPATPTAPAPTAPVAAVAAPAVVVEQAETAVVSDQANEVPAAITPAVAGGDRPGGWRGDIRVGPSLDLSKPARLGGMKRWDCRVRSTTIDSLIIRVRALVTADGAALRIEIIDSDAGPNILRLVLPCAQRERYVPGLGPDGKLATVWSDPFRIVVIGGL